MNFPKILSSSFLLLCCFAGNAQTTKPADKCTDECCKETKQTKKSTSTIKPVVMTETLAKKKVIACKLTRSELQKRKAEVIEKLKSKILDKQELTDGYKYKFNGTDQILDEITSFIKSERLCCDFFSFALSVSDDIIWLTISGPDGAKDFVKTEMNL
jgi:hypothetical protein